MDVYTSMSLVDNLGVSLDDDNLGLSLEKGHELGLSMTSIESGANDSKVGYRMQSSYLNSTQSSISDILGFSEDQQADGIGFPLHTSTPAKQCEDYGAVKANYNVARSSEKRLTTIINPGYKMVSKALDAKNILQSMRCHCYCGKNCIKSRTAKNVYEMRYHYWMKPRYVKMQWLISIISCSEQKGRYRFLNIDNQKVCVKGFLTLLGVNKNTYLRAKNLSKQKMLTLSCKNPRNPTDHTLNAISWLEKYGNFYGDRMPNSSDILLPYRTVRRHVYKKYLNDIKDMNENSVSEARFYKIWNTRLPQLKIRKSSSFSKCSTCYTLERHQGKTLCPKARLELCKQKEEHNERQMTERRFYYTKRQQSKSDPDNYMSIIIDGMDQSKSNLPHFAGRTSKNINPVDLLKTHITGVINHGHGGFHSYVDFNQFPHDPNLTMNILLKSIKKAAESCDNKLPPVLYVQADNCYRENRNKYMLGFLQMLVTKNIFKEVQLSFLIVGHTHEDIDAAFSVISRKLRSTDTETLPELINLVGQCELLNSLFDIKSWILPHLNDLKGISKPLHFRVAKVSSTVKTFYKGHCLDAWIELNLNPLNCVPSGKPNALNADYSKIDVSRNFKQIEIIKSYFASISSYSFWKTFYDKIMNCQNPLSGQSKQWILDQLPQQESGINDVYSLPDELTSLLNKEKETPKMDAKLKKRPAPKKPAADRAPKKKTK